MNILYFFAERPTPMYTWQRIHIFDELQRHGINFKVFNPLNYPTINIANEELVKEADPSRYDLFFTASFPDHLYASSVESIKAKGLKTVLISWDNLELPYLHKANARSFDLVWVTSKETKNIFENWGCKNVIFQTYAANPYIFTPSRRENIWSVGFIGSPYGSRSNKLNELLDGGIDCSVYSNSLFELGYNSSLGKKQSYNIRTVLWKLDNYLRFDIGRKVLWSTIKNKIENRAELNTDSEHLHKFRSVSDSEMIRLYSDFALSLNISELRDTGVLKTPVHKIHLRSFEIPMSGGAQFVKYFDEMAEYFEEDKEIVFYHNKEEMIEKAKFYLNPKNEKELVNIKKAARKRAEGEHTWMRRFEIMFENLK